MRSIRNRLQSMLFRDAVPREVYLCLGGAPNWILDVGCNDATTSRFFAHMFPSAQVAAFEADPFVAAEAARLSRRNPRIAVISAALSDKDGLAEFRRSGGRPPGLRGKLALPVWTQSGSMLEPGEHLSVWPWVRFEEPILVPTIRLDAWWEISGSPKVDLVWMDVQGLRIA